MTLGDKGLTALAGAEDGRKDHRQGIGAASRSQGPRKEAGTQLLPWSLQQECSPVDTVSEPRETRVRLPA